MLSSVCLPMMNMEEILSRPRVRVVYRAADECETVHQLIERLIDRCEYMVDEVPNSTSQYQFDTFEQIKRDYNTALGHLASNIKSRADLEAEYEHWRALEDILRDELTRLWVP